MVTVNELWILNLFILEKTGVSIVYVIEKLPVLKKSSDFSLIFHVKRLSNRLKLDQ